MADSILRDAYTAEDISNLLAISYAVEEWMAGRISDQDLRDTASACLAAIAEADGID